MYFVLGQKCAGEARAIIQSVDGFRGCEAWLRLFRKYIARTLALEVLVLGEACAPPKMKDLMDIEVGIDRWEAKGKVLQSQFNQEIGNNMEVTIFSSMMPHELKDFILQILAGKIQYNDLKQAGRSVQPTNWH